MASSNMVPSNMVISQHNVPIMKLICAICDKKKTTVEKKLIQEIDLNFIDYYGNTLMHYAVREGKLEVVELLIAEKAPTNKENNFRETPMILATKSNSPSKSKIQALLSRHLSSGSKKVALKTFDEGWSHQRLPEAIGIGGELYETKLLALILYRAQQHKDVEKFYLGTNVHGVGAFDDIVLRYKITDQPMEKILFIQAKHKEKTGKKTSLTYGNSNQGDFNLNKYMESFITIKHMFHKNQGDDFFREKFEDIQIDLIIYTPPKVTCESLKHSLTAFNDDKLIHTSAANDKIIFESIQSQSETFGESMKATISSTYTAVIPRILKIYPNCEIHLMKQSEETGKLERMNISSDTLKKDIEDTKANTYDCRSEFGDTGIPIIFNSRPEFDRTLINDFLGKLIIYQNQGNEDHVEKTLKCEMEQSLPVNVTPLQIDLIFLQFHAAVQSYWREKGTVLFLTKDCDFFKKAQESVTNSLLPAVNNICRNKINEYGIEFKVDSDLEKLVKDFVSGTKKLFNFQSSYSKLSCIRLLQQLKEKTDFIYIDIDYILPRPPKDEYQQLLDAVASTTTKLLVIKSEGEVIEQLRAVDKKIILVSENAFHLWCPSWVTDEEVVVREDNIVGLCDFSDQCQEHFLKTHSVKFHGQTRGLDYLMVNDESRKLIDAEAIQFILNGGVFELANQSVKSKQNNVFIKYDDALDYYIDRTFSPSIVNSKVTSVTSKFSIIHDADKDHRLSKNKEILVVSENKERFNLLCQENAENIIHWLSPKSSYYIWRQTYSGNQSGSSTCLTALREFLDHQAGNFERRTLNDAENRFTILTAEPGMGKSTLLSKLAEIQTKSQDQCMWTVRINLLGSTTIFSQWENDETYIDEVTVVDFLLKLQYSDELELYFKLVKTSETEPVVIKIDNILRLNNDLIDVIGHMVMTEMRIFLDFYNHGKIILLVDGVDEIAPDYKNSVLKFIHTLIECKIAKIWVTTRPAGILVDLENSLNTFAYTLRPFSLEDSRNLLKKYWEVNSSLSKFENKSFMIFTDKLLKLFSQSIGNREKEFISIPLQIKMLAMIFQDTFEQFHRSGEEKLSSECEKSIEDKLDLLTLYEKFIDIKFNDVFLKEKYELNLTQPIFDAGFRQREMRRHEHLSLYTLFNEQELKVLLSEKNREEIDEYLRDVDESKERVGIIYRVVDRKPIFVHQTFAEYFSSLFIWNIIQSSGPEEFEQITEAILIGNLLVNDRVQIFKFINLKAKKDFVKMIELPKKIDFLLERIIYYFYRYELKTESAKILLKLVSFLTSDEARKLYSITSENVQKRMKENREIANWLGSASLKFKSGSKNTMHTTLHFAAQNGHKNIVKRLIKRGANIDARTSVHNCTPLHLAALNGFKDVCKLLIDNGADKDAKTSTNKITPLHYAAQKGRKEVAELLLERGAPADAQTSDCGFTALHYAAQGANEGLVRLLLDKKCDIDAIAQKNGYVPLHLAILHDRHVNARILIERNANIHLKTEKEKETSFQLALRKGCGSIITILLIKGADVHEPYLDGEKPIHVAVRMGLSRVKILLKGKADVNCVTRNDGKTPLRLAIDLGKHAIPNLLRQHGGVLDAVTNNINCTPLQVADLHAAAASKSSLLKQKHELNKTRVKRRNDMQTTKPERMDYACHENENWTQMHLAAYHGNMKRLKELIGANEDINASTEEDGITPLHIAVERGHIEAVELLLDNKAKAEALNTLQYPEGDKFTPFHRACKYGNKEIVKLFLRDHPERLVKLRSSSGWTPLHVAARFGHTNIINLLVELGSFIDDNETVTGITPLHLALESRKVDSAERLVELGANAYISKKDRGDTAFYLAFQCHLFTPLILKILQTNIENKDKVCDENNSTPLHHAVRFGNIEIFEWLVKEKVNLNARKKDGTTPLHILAQVNKNKFRIQMVQTLIEGGADLNAMTAEGRTPLHLAAQSNYKGLIKLLIEEPKCKVNTVATDKDYTALHFVVENGDSDLVTTMVEHGAIVDTKALDIAKEKHRSDIADFLRQELSKTVAS